MTDNSNAKIGKANKKLIVILLSIITLVAAVAICFAIYLNSNSLFGRLQQQLDLGYKYLEELNYEQAIAAFEAAIEIDPKNVEAYKGLIDAYIQNGDDQLAIEAAQRAFEETEDEHFLRIIEELSVEDEAVDALGIEDDVFQSVGDVYLVQSALIRDAEEYMMSTYDYYDGGYTLTTDYYNEEIESYAKYNDSGECIYLFIGTDDSYTEWIYSFGYEGDRIISSNTTRNFYINGELENQDISIGSYEYDEEGNCTIIYDYGEIDYLKYDEQGNLIYRQITSADGKSTTTKYMYDCRGNVVMTEDSEAGVNYRINTYSDGVVLSADNPNP